MNTSTQTFPSLRVNSDRMLAAFNELAQIGSTGDGGVHRPTFSEAHLSVRRWFREQIESAGLDFRTDGAGNHSAFLPASGIASRVAAKHSPVPVETRVPSASVTEPKTLLLGSHLDSVPNGGRFDGAWA